MFKAFLKLLCAAVAFTVFIVTGLKVRAEEGQWTQVNNSLYFYAVETTPWGIVIGENDGRIWLNPYNGLYISADLGNTWKPFGLLERGVTDIKYFDNKVYATTYYSVDGMAGLFVSEDAGETWEHLGPNVSASAVSADAAAIYLGTYSYGLWVSTDNGQTWNQKLVETEPSSTVSKIETPPENITDITSALPVLVAIGNNVYKTNDHGNTWQKIQDLHNKSIRHFAIGENIILAGNTGGLYKSVDNGNTWSKVESFGENKVNGLTYYKNVFYAGKNNSVYKSTDNGVTWLNTNLSLENWQLIRDMTWTHASPDLIFTVVNGGGIYKYEIPKFEFLSNKFLAIPWNTTNENAFLDTITAYVDHEYPLLEYGYYSEPQNTRETTVNFMGIKEKPPTMYYSSHNGTDFALPYGTEIKAPAAGIASYYWCKACGNTIKINHQNGFQTTYMHLQKTDLITPNEPVSVTTGQTIGKVGMTGNTTGPHLHFTVTKDTNNNGNFTDEIPNGNTDPYGWLSENTKDPWPNFVWSDNLGTHTGTTNIYLWNQSIKQVSQFITENQLTVEMENKKVEVNLLDSKEPFTLLIKNYIAPFVDKNLKYIENSSFLLEGLNLRENEIKLFNHSVKIRLDLNNSDLSNTTQATIKLYYFDEDTNNWQSLPSIWNENLKILTAETTHFSQFAVFGEKTDSEPPETGILVQGENINGWYMQYPTIELHTNNTKDTIFYSLNEGDTWDTYTQTLTLENDGIHNVLFKSQDINNNMEETNNYVIKVNTQNKNTKELTIVGAVFKTLDTGATTPTTSN